MKTTWCIYGVCIIMYVHIFSWTQDGKQQFQSSLVIALLLLHSRFKKRNKGAHPAIQKSIVAVPKLCLKKKGCETGPNFTKTFHQTIRISRQAGADVKEDLKNWAKQQEAELAEAWAIVFGSRNSHVNSNMVLTRWAPMIVRNWSYGTSINGLING